MSFLDRLFQGLEDFAESDTGKRMMDKAAQIQADEKNRTSGRNGLRCAIDSLVNNGYDVCCEGTVRNIGKSTYNKVVVTVVFKNQDGNVVDRTSTYAVSYGSTFFPSESRPFRAHSMAKGIKSANASISEFEEK